MPKRFTETNKWEDKWFRRLSPTEKLVFIYMCEKCDSAGFYEVDNELMAFHTGLSEQEIEGAYEGLARGLLGANGVYWIRNFLKHQKNENLNPENNAHKPIIASIYAHADDFKEPLKLAPKQPLIRGTGIGKGKGKGNKGGMGGMKKPTIEDVREYCSQRGNYVNPQAFYDWCLQNGWRLSNGNTMRDWKAAVRTWETKSFNQPQNQGGIEGVAIS